MVSDLNDRRWGKVLDSGWSSWDVEIYCRPWTLVAVTTAQEDYGGGKRLIRARFRARPGVALLTLGILGAAGLSAGAALGHWAAVAVGATLLVAAAAIWVRGVRQAGRAVILFDAQAAALGLSRCDPFVWRNGAVGPDHEMRNPLP